MLTRLQVSGFKNLMGVDVRFGPFTCVIGLNGVGKSNLFDAIRFLSVMADKTFLDAARSVRDDSGRAGDVRALFHQAGDHPQQPLRFSAEMIVPPTAEDDFGQTAKALTRLLRYTVELGYVPPSADLPSGGLELLKEELTYLKPAELKRAVQFDYSPEWFDAAVRPHEVRKSPFVATRAGKSGERQIWLHPDGDHHRLTRLPAARTPRTVVSRATASESPTAVVAKREMMSWRLYQLEPAALRRPDDLNALPPRPQLELNGAHLPATLYRLARLATQPDGTPDEDLLYTRVANRLHELVPDIKQITVERDEIKRTMTLMARDRYGVVLPAAALSDGTLRFLALTALEVDPEAVGVICFEEPENGIHPDRIPAMLALLRAIAADVELTPGEDNPLRQVIVNTHSPAVLEQVPPAELLAAVPRPLSAAGQQSRGVVFKPMRGTWRAEGLSGRDLIPPGVLMPYLRRDRESPAEPPGLFSGHPAAL